MYLKAKCARHTAPRGGGHLGPASGEWAWDSTELLLTLKAKSGVRGAGRHPSLLLSLLSWDAVAVISLKGGPRRRDWVWDACRVR